MSSVTNQPSYTQRTTRYKSPSIALSYLYLAVPPYYLSRLWRSAPMLRDLASGCCRGSSRNSAPLRSSSIGTRYAYNASAVPGLISECSPADVAVHVLCLTATEYLARETRGRCRQHPKGARGSSKGDADTEISGISVSYRRSPLCDSY